MRRTLHIVLAVSLLLLSWLQLAHELDLHAHHPGQACEMCLFTGHLAHGAPSTVATPAPVHARYAFFEIEAYDSPVIAQPFHAYLGKRGPPALSFV